MQTGPSRGQPEGQLWWAHGNTEGVTGPQETRALQAEQDPRARCYRTLCGSRVWADLVLQSRVEDKMERAESANRGDQRHGRTRRWRDSRDGGGSGELGWEGTSYCQDTAEASGLWPRQSGGHRDPGGGQGAEAISPPPCEQGTAGWPRATLDAKQGAELKSSSLVLACGSFTGSARFHEQPPHNYTHSSLVVTGHLLCCDDRSDGDSEQRTCVGRCYVVATYLEKRVKCQYPQTKLL